MSDATVSGLTGMWTEERETPSPRAGDRAAAAGARAGARTTWQLPDGRRSLQLALAATWLLDGVLQMQPYMFSTSFGRFMLASAAIGNPAPVYHSVVWGAREIGAHAAAANAVFCIIQIAIGLGIAARPTVRAALALSVVWSAAVWWFGEGLGGLLTGTASPVTGAPGAVILYALLAVLLWPSDRHADGPFIAARAVGARAARCIWVVLWVGLGLLGLQAANRAPDSLSSMIASMAAGEPRWLAVLDRHMATALAGQGLSAAIVLTVILALVGFGVLAPARIFRAMVVLAVVFAVVIWIVGEALGGIFSGSGTDPNTGPLLILIALAYWPVVRAVPASLPAESVES